MESIRKINSHLLSQFLVLTIAVAHEEEDASGVALQMFNHGLFLLICHPTLSHNISTRILMKSS